MSVTLATLHSASGVHGTGEQRLHVLDVLRGIALLGMFLSGARDLRLPHDQQQEPPRGFRPGHG